MSGRETPAEPRLAVALGGGGVRGAVHLGVLHALFDAGLRPALVAGTSSGAVAGLLYALELERGDAPRVEAMQLIEAIGARGFSELHRLLAGKPGETLRERLSTLVGWERLLRAGVTGPAITSIEPMRAALTRLVGPRSFESLPIPLAFVAADLLSGQKAVLTSGPLVPALLASCSVPGVFPPVAHQGMLLVDGHVLDNVPASVARAALQGQPGIVLGVDVGFDEPAPVRTALDVILRAAAVSREALRADGLKHADSAIHVGDEVPSGIFEIERAAALYAAGLERGREIAPTLQAALAALARPRRWFGRAAPGPAPIPKALAGPNLKPDA
ncbi:MAG TPA: patatin-like phospholipase family protein [Deinococcales bacterium]|nr:patatin-like phospholipase family protein [Deinococcales bacterium]